MRYTSFHQCRSRCGHSPSAVRQARRQQVLRRRPFLCQGRLQDRLAFRRPNRPYRCCIRRCSRLSRRRCLLPNRYRNLSNSIDGQRRRIDRPNLSSRLIGLGRSRSFLFDHRNCRKHYLGHGIESDHHSNGTRRNRSRLLKSAKPSDPLRRIARSHRNRSFRIDRRMYCNFAFYLSDRRADRHVHVRSRRRTKRGRNAWRVDRVIQDVRGQYNRSRRVDRTNRKDFRSRLRNRA